MKLLLDGECGLGSHSQNHRLAPPPRPHVFRRPVRRVLAQVVLDVVAVRVQVAAHDRVVHAAVGLPHQVRELEPRDFSGRAQPREIPSIPALDAPPNSLLAVELAGALRHHQRPERRAYRGLHGCFVRPVPVEHEPGPTAFRQVRRHILEERYRGLLVGRCAHAKHRTR